MHQNIILSQEQTIQILFLTLTEMGAEDSSVVGQA